MEQLRVEIWALSYGSDSRTRKRVAESLEIGLETSLVRVAHARVDSQESEVRLVVGYSTRHAQGLMG